MRERVLVVGEALVDIVHRRNGEVDEHAGGSPLNVAIGLARLGHPVQYAARFAQDRYGEMIRAHLGGETLLTLTPGTDQAEKTSTARATLDPTGAATYDFDLVWDVAEALDDAPIGHLHTGSIAATLQPGADAVLAAARRAQQTGTVSYDPNARPSLMGSPDLVRDRVEQLIGLADVVKASDEDMAWLYDGADLTETLTRWGQMGPCLVVVTMGAKGSRVLVPATGERMDVPAPPSNVVDTVGAGDSYMAGLVSGLLDSGFLGEPAARERFRQARLEDVLPAVHRAVACADITVSRAGANPPTRAELPD